MGWHSVKMNRRVMLSAHQRHGILGPHVRIMIYDGETSRRLYDPRNCPNYSLGNTICSIGLYCTNLEQVVLWRVHYVDWRDDGWPADWQDELNNGCLSPSLARAAVVVRDTVLRLGNVSLPVSPTHGWSATYTLKRQIHHWSVPSGAFRLPVCTRDELAWIVKYLPSLPESYHEWANDGIWIDEHYLDVDKSYEAIDLRKFTMTGDVDHDLLAILAFCIIHEKVHPETDPPPASLNPLPAAKRVCFPDEDESNFLY